LDAAEDLAALQFDAHRLETRCDRAAWFQDRLDDVCLGEAAAQPSQLGADPLAPLAEAVALEAQRLVGVEEDLTAVRRVAGTRQGRPRQPLVAGGTALATKAKLKLAGSLDPGQANQ